MSRRKLTASELLAQLRDDLQRARMAGDDTTDLLCEIEQVQAQAIAEAVIEREAKNS